MPRGQIILKANPEYNLLREKLKAEWQNPQDDSAAPVIIETTGDLRPQITPTHLYVIWDDWEHLSQLRRSEMIMETYEQIRGRAAALSVTSAMGLTSGEARNLGIEYVIAE